MKKLALVFLLLTNLFAWDDALLDALYNFDLNRASEEQKALILQKNSVINQMRIQGQISEKTYQKTQNYYSDFVEDLGKKVSAQNGALMSVQPRDPNKSFDAGTDSDFITNATSLEQVKAIQNDFNREFEAHLRGANLDVASGEKWTEINDIDFMVDPDGVDEKTFKEISKIQNDAYSRPDAARYEIKTRNAQQPTSKEIAAYKDEMSDFINKKKQKSLHLCEQLIEMKKDPAFYKEGTREWKQRKLKEAQLHQINAQNAKYQDRSIDANNKMAQALGVDISSPDLPNRAKTRAPSQETSVQKRATLSAMLNASNKHLTSQSQLNEALLLSVQATNEPHNAKELNKRIIEVTDRLDSSQKGEFLQRIKDTDAVSNATVKNINNAMKVNRNHSLEPTHLKSSKLAKAGTAFGLVGDLMSMSEQLEKASKGEHLLININNNERSSLKALKGASVALLELAPVPIIDTLENYDVSDKKAKQMLIKAIQRGDHISPAMVTAMVFSDTAVQSISAAVIDPLIQSKEAIKQGVQTTSTLMQNYKNRQALDKDDAKNRQRFNDYAQRAQKIKLGPINAKGRSSDGSTYTILDNVQLGDRLYFYVPKRQTWESTYLTSWEIRKSAKLIKKQKKTPLSSKNSNRFTFTNNYENGDYEIIFRIFNANAKQLDFTTLKMRVNQKFDMSPIVILDSSKKVISNTNLTKDKKYIFGINPIGNWNNSYKIEWFLNGDKLKSSSADASKIQAVWIHFDDYIGDGRHQVSVRAIKEGKIVSHKAVTVQIKSSTREKKKMSALEKLRAKMNKEKSKSQGPANTSSKIEDILETGETSLAQLDKDEREYTEALASIQRSKEAMARMDREDAEFWSGFVEGLAIAGKAIGENTKNYAKPKYEKSTYSSNQQDFNKWDGEELGFKDISLDDNYGEQSYYAPSARSTKKKTYTPTPNEPSTRKVHQTTWAIQTLEYKVNPGKGFKEIVTKCFLVKSNTPPYNKVGLGTITKNAKNYKYYKYYTYAVELRDDGRGHCQNIINKEARGTHDIVGFGFSWKGKPNLIIKE